MLWRSGRLRLPARHNSQNRLKQMLSAQENSVSYDPVRRVWGQLRRNRASLPELRGLCGKSFARRDFFFLAAAVCFQ